MRNNLKNLRENQGLTQTALAQMLNVSQRTISKWELGNSTPSPAQMQFLQELFKEPKEKIFFGAFNYKMLLKIDDPTTILGNHTEDVS
ncbi:helix-turn-helix transcriptional regulator [Levilactobacillus brevis]|uniref:helix-turn-helix transcriptional regulator n=1 Tax=Levilactobacillus brevis TaxID=1580 RepID=UPI00374F6BDA